MYDSSVFFPQHNGFITNVNKILITKSSPEDIM